MPAERAEGGVAARRLYEAIPFERCCGPNYTTVNFASSRIHRASWRSSQTLRSKRVVA